MVRPSKAPGAEAKSKVKRICGAEGCKLEVRGTDLAKHYKSNTNFSMLAELKTLSLEAADNVLKNNADPHTAYMYTHNHSVTDLPNWNTHKPARKPVPSIFKPKVIEENPGEANNEAEESSTEDGNDDVQETEVPLNDDVIQITDENSNEPPIKKAKLNIERKEDNNLTDDEDDEDDDVEGGNENDETKGESEAEAGEDVQQPQLKIDVDQIKEALKNMKTELSNEVIEELSEKIATKAAEKTVQLMKLEEAKKELETVKVEDCWIEGDTMYSCRSCGIFSDRKDVPQNYSKSKKGTFGVIEKFKSNGERRKKTHIMQSIKEHSENRLHIYCCMREKKEEKEVNDFEKDNKDAGRITIRNVVKTLKRQGSSVDFISENNIFHLESEYQDITVATKNNSTDAFFQIRDVVFEVVGEKTKSWFAPEGEGKVEEIAVTLDKVTIQRVSYTALLTYFFYNGVIYVILNKLYTMRVDEYDSEGTARAAVQHLTETLGITR